MPDLQKAKDACLAWLAVLDVLVGEKAMRLTARAGWGHMMQPKFHWSLHYEDCVQRFQCLLACWALERKHKAVRKYGTASTNTTRFDLSMLEEVCAEQISGQEH